MGELSSIFIKSNTLILVMIGLFWALLFIQSGLDKVFDWKGNISWLTGHFEKSILANMVKPMVAILAMTEIVAGVLSLCGAGQALVSGQRSLLGISLLLSMVSLLMLFFGQRLAKDYEGARSIAVYFGVALVSAAFVFGLS